MALRGLGHELHLLDVIVVLQLHLDLDTILDFFKTSPLRAELGVDQVARLDLELEDPAAVTAHLGHRHLTGHATGLDLILAAPALVLEDVALPTVNPRLGQRQGLGLLVFGGSQNGADVAATNLFGSVVVLKECWSSLT